ncbi:MAG: short-chain dehydrogenase [Bdellovibrio sp. CG12_big_fil_rev_8_21_14_0_65_39_13]|nr:MAG: short-chain dehydrogenase [Bdellovibrio sp. CG22_combo_CG10-13_8_21_14_all_39_27]PIQ59027.1 MAG: short-chain dehydrogenase [Bdellovibrio sp. CG12_big_fil_rev_8_21_14_0_65_39_13]PIR33003.1 MAG: short-chain dehydrogenase [Bdellovibrio sp. CG11_big_fil_rev_8_21_14_0_20_39_38]PJB53327.1 MAG: short-chain dehydrogenase [Bdellovibrio sp. CG_4_9_14_3_um_filter_39_7]
MNIENKVVFVTGSNRGIGRSLVEAVLAKGANKVYASSRNASSRIGFNDERVVYLNLDITELNQIKKASEMAQDTQILINNAGILNQGNILEGDFENIHSNMNVNFFSTINMMREFVPILERNKSSAIINIVSIAAYSNFPFIAGYSASKAALYSATQAARIELKKKGIQVFAVNPGAIDTDMNKGYEGEMTSSKDVALAILNELALDVPDIIPDKVGKAMFEVWKADPAGLEAMASKMYHKE